MKSTSYMKWFLAASLAFLVMSGCSSLLTENKRAMQIEDIIDMGKAGMESDVIISQIEVTRSRFKLDTNQIIRLKEEGIEDKVIEAMIETGEVPEYFDQRYSYSPYDYLYNYYYDPRYPGGYPYYPFRTGDIMRFKRPFDRYEPIYRSPIYPAPTYPPTRDFKLHRWTYPGIHDLFLNEKDN